MSDDTGKKSNKKGDKEFPSQTFAEDMSDEWSKDAIKAARDAFALTIGKHYHTHSCRLTLPSADGVGSPDSWVSALPLPHSGLALTLTPHSLSNPRPIQLTLASGDVHATIADFIRKKFDRDHDRGWNCVVGRSFGAYVTHEIKTYMYYSVMPGTYILLWRS